LVIIHSCLWRESFPILSRPDGIFFRKWAPSQACEYSWIIGFIMADIIEIGGFAHVFEIGALVNVAYGMMGGNLPSPVDNYIKLEQKVRSRLKKLAKSEDVELMAEKKKIRTIGRGSESVLGFFRQLTTFMAYSAGLACLLFLVAIGYSDMKMSKTAVGVIIGLVFISIPLMRLSLWAMTAFYAWRVEVAVIGLATKLKVHEEVEKVAGGQSRPKLLKVAMDHIEPVFERGIPSG